MDVVLPLRRARPDPDHARWVVRSWEENFDFDRLIVVSSRRPKWLGEDVRLIEVPQHNSKFWSIGANLEATLKEASDEFIWLNDDFFLLERLDVVPLTNKGPWDHVIWNLGAVPEAPGDHQDYIAGFHSQRNILRAWGYDTSTEPCTDLHTPFPVNRERMVDVLGRVKREFPDHWTGHFRGLYGAGLPSERMEDVKIKSSDRLPGADWWTVSTSMKSWNGQTGVMLRERFSTPSRFER